MKFSYLIIVLLVGSLWAGCNVINPHEDIPTYIHVDSFAFKTVEPTLTGAGSHDIGTVWAYYNNNLIGAYQLPANIPILAHDKGSLQLAPGITVDGNNDFQSVYPYYLTDTSSFQAQPGKVINYQPVTSYAVAATNFLWKEDFNVGNSFTNLSGDTSLVRTTDPQFVWGGGGSGLIYLNHAGDSCESIMQTANKVVMSAGESIVEIDNMGVNATLTVGLVAIYNGTPSTPYYIAGFYPSSTWHKEYISVGTALSNLAADSYLLVIKASLPADKASGYVAVDNIKILTTK